MYTLALIGATGLTGRAVLIEALSTGKHVRALRRSHLSSHDIPPHPHLTWIDGDAADPTAISTLLQGADGVISTVGPGRNSGLKICAQCSDLVCQRLGTRHYVVLGGAGTVMPSDRRTLKGHAVAWLMKHIGGAMQEDKNEEVQHLLQYPLKWTLVRAPMIRPGDRHLSLTVCSESPGRLFVDAHSLARLLLARLDMEPKIGVGVFIR